MQSLVEKHFPAPDRNRIHRIIGDLPGTQNPSEGENFAENAGGSGGSSKRKPVRQAAQRASKKVRPWSSEEEISEEDRNGGHSSGSEFKLSGSESEDDNKSDEEISNPSSDYNPFDSDSDSDLGELRSQPEIKISARCTLLLNSTKFYTYCIFLITSL